MKKYFLIFSIFFIFAFCVFVQAWQEPTQTPPLDNIDSPINVGLTSQTKAGDLIIYPGQIRTSKFVDEEDNNYYADPSGVSVLKNGLAVGTSTFSGGAILEVDGNIKLSGASPTYRINNVFVDSGSDLSDAANKGYVDSLLDGVDVPSCGIVLSNSITPFPGYAYIGRWFSSNIPGLNFYLQRPNSCVSACTNGLDYGPEYSFCTSGTPIQNSTAKLSPTNILIAYRSSDGFARAVAGTISGSSITFGPVFQFTFDQTISISTAVIDSTRVLIAYAENTGLIGKAIIATVDPSDNSISYGQPFNFDTKLTVSNNNNISATPLDSTRVLIAYNAVPFITAKGFAVIATVSGTSTIAFGARYLFSSTPISYTSAVTLSSSKALIAYGADSLYGLGTAVIADITGTTISTGTAAVFNNANTEFVSAVALDPNKVFIAYTDRSNNFYGTAVLGDISGSIITFGSEYMFGTPPYVARYISAKLLDTNRVIIAHADGYTSFRGSSMVANISASNISFGLKYDFADGYDPKYTSVVTLDPSRIFLDYDRSGGGYSMIVSCIN